MLSILRLRSSAVIRPEESRWLDEEEGGELEAFAEEDEGGEDELFPDFLG